MKYKGLLWYGVLFVSIIAVIIFEANFFYSRISDITARETEIKNRIQTLQARQKILSSLSEEVLSKSTKILQILPSENATLSVSAQIRNAAIENGIAIKNLSVISASGITDTDYNSVQIAFVAEGPSLPLIVFLSSLKDFAPIMRLESANINVTTSVATAQVNMQSFWAPLPTTLPSITESIPELSNEEQDLLNEVDMYKLPNFSSTDQLPDLGSSESGTINPQPFTRI